ncbi:MAG: PorV/PorQ family protein [bacterium]|nr:PorV/PorQ family protein [bacterium]
MNLRFKLVLVFVLILLTTNHEPRTVFAASHSNSGTTSAQVLEQKPGTRPAAMGGAFAAIVDDSNAVTYNPAGLAYLTKTELQFNQNKYFSEVTSNYIGWVYPLDEMHARNVFDMGTLAGNVNFVDYGTIAGRDNSGNDSGEFGARDRVISLAYGKAFTTNFSIGIAGRQIVEEIAATKAHGYSFDAGVLFTNIMDTFNIGIAAQNLGDKITFDKEAAPLPTNYVVGTALNLFANRLTLAADLNKPVNDYYHWNFGSEFWLTNVLALRLGYDTKHDIGNGLSTGIGLSLQDFEFAFVPLSELAINYAYVPHGDLGVIHQIELVLKIGIE